MSQTVLVRFANVHGVVVTVQPDGPNIRISCECGFWNVEGNEGTARNAGQAHAEKCLALPK